MQIPEDIAVPGAFALGLVAGSFATIRLMRWLLAYLRQDQEKRGP